MSDFSLTLVLQNKTSKIINDMAKVSIKSEKISAFGGIFFVLDKFDSILSSVIDSHLGLRSTLIGYQYSETIRAANFYRYIVALPLMAILFGIKATDRLEEVMPSYLLLHPCRRYRPWCIYSGTCTPKCASKFFREKFVNFA